MRTNIIDDRITRINELLIRLEEIPYEIDAIHEKLYQGFITSHEFKKLVEQRSNLLLEQQIKKRKLREEYHVLEEEQSI